MSTVNAIESQIKAHLIATNTKEVMQHNIHNLIGQTLKEKFHGKKVTKRLVTLVEPLIQEMLPDVRVHWSTDYGMYQITLWGGSIPYESRWSFFIAHDSDVNAYDAAAFGTKHDTCHAQPAADRIAARNRLLKEEKTIRTLAQHVVSILQARAEIERLTDTEEDANTVHYFVRDLLEGKEG